MNKLQHSAIRRAMCVLVALCCFFALQGTAFAKPLRVLVSGFEAFGGMQHNPTQELAQGLATVQKQVGKNFVLRGVVLPVTYAGAWLRLKQEIQTFKPHVVLAFGLASGASGIRLETQARNYDCGGRDNEGASHRGVIRPGAPNRLPATLPLEAFESALIKAGYNVHRSNNAGGYLCNNVFYNLMFFSQQQQATRAGFIHVSAMPMKGKLGLTRALQLIVRNLQ